MTGIICVNKDKDITSFGVVAKTRGITREKKAGHTGTLDPMATGVLPIMLGGATRFLNFLPDSDKGYRATFLLGKTTDTLDITGNVTSECDVTASRDDVLGVLPRFVGKIKQIPPMYSAKSVDGVRLYDLARQGKEIEREACEVEIKELNLVENNGDEYVIDVLCSKGTYIRSLIDDIGKALGCGAVMTALCRTRAMGFSLDDCITLADMQEIRDNDGDFAPYIHSVEEMFSDYARVAISLKQSVRFCNGGALDITRVKNVPEINTPCTVYGAGGEFLGLGENDGTELKMLRLLSRRD